MLDSGPANFLLWGENMKKIFDSAALESIADSISADCAMLDYVDADSLDDVEFYAARIRAVADEIKSLVYTAEPVKWE